MAKNILHHLSSLLNCSILQFPFLIVKKQQLAAFLYAHNQGMWLGSDQSLGGQCVKRVLSSCPVQHGTRTRFGFLVALVEWPTFYFGFNHDKEKQMKNILIVEDNAIARIN